MHAPVDIALVLLYAVVWLVIEMVRLPATRARMAAAPLGGRTREYRNTMIAEWSLAGLVLARLAYGHLPVTAIGLGWPHGPLGWALSALGVGLAVWLVRRQERGALGSERGRAALARALSGFSWMMPRESREFRAFYALSVTAGVCEEVLYRGHLFAFLDPLVGPWLGTAAGVAVFGLAHSYQGPSGIVRTALVGLIMALVYRATGSLLAPIVMHAVMDWGGGRLVEKAVGLGLDLATPPAGPGAAGAPAAPARAGR